MPRRKLTLATPMRRRGIVIPDVEPEDRIGFGALHPGQDTSQNDRSVLSARQKRISHRRARKDGERKIGGKVGEAVISEEPYKSSKNDAAQLDGALPRGETGTIRPPPVTELSPSTETRPTRESSARTRSDCFLKCFPRYFYRQFLQDSAVGSGQRHFLNGNNKKHLNMPRTSNVENFFYGSHGIFQAYFASSSPCRLGMRKFF